MKKFYEGLKDIFWGTTQKVWKWKFKLIFILMQLPEMYRAGRVSSLLNIIWKDLFYRIFQLNTDYLFTFLKKLGIRNHFLSFYFSVATSYWNNRVKIKPCACFVSSPTKIYFSLIFVFFYVYSHQIEYIQIL